MCPNVNDPYTDMPRCDDVHDCVPASNTSGAVFVCALAPPAVVGGAKPLECEANSCPSEQICHSTGPALECLTPCTQTGAPACSGRCAPNDPFADVRGCAPQLCDAIPSYDCGPVSDCMPDATGRQSDGCLRKHCITNQDCPCGTCSAGVCYERPLHCFPMLFAP